MRSWNLYRLKRALCWHARKNSWLCSDRGRGFNDRTFASPTAGCCVAQSSRAGPKTPLLVVCWTTLSHVYALGLARNKAILALRLLTPTRYHLRLRTPVPLNRPTMILTAFHYDEIISNGFCNNWFELNVVSIIIELIYSRALTVQLHSISSGQIDKWQVDRENG